MVARKGFMATQTLLGWEQFVELPEQGGYPAGAGRGEAH